jgi:hypothetical protein
MEAIHRSVGFGGTRTRREEPFRVFPRLGILASICQPEARRFDLAYRVSYHKGSTEDVPIEEVPIGTP